MEEINIHGYKVSEPLKSENSGNSIWGQAQKDSRKYFIKQLKETYCDIPFEKATLFQKEEIEANQSFERRILRLCSFLSKSNYGNLVVPLDFLKQDGHYYIVTDWIDTSSSFSEIYKLTEYQKHLMLKVLSYSIYGMAENKIVHCDLKPDNIRIKDTVSHAKTLKIIDFDSGFIEGDYPDMIGGDQVYMAPEVIIRMSQDEKEIESKIPITTKADIFSLGILFHEILTGELPKSKDPEKSYIGLAVGYGIDLIFSKKLALEYSELIRSMLAVEPEKRPDALSVFCLLKHSIDPLKLHYGGE